MNKRLTTDMADANGLKIAIRPTGFFSIKKTAADFCNAQFIMDNTGSLNFISLHFSLKNNVFNNSFQPFFNPVKRNG